LRTYYTDTETKKQALISQLVQRFEVNAATWPAGIAAAGGAAVAICDAAQFWGEVKSCVSNASDMQRSLLAPISCVAKHQLAWPIITFEFDPLVLVEKAAIS